MHLLIATLLLAPTAVDLPPGTPDELKPWIPWVLHGHERALCPVRSEGPAAGTAVCESPGRLELVVDKQGGSFTQSWRIEAPGILALPGDERRWPLDVEVDGKPALVGRAGSAPGVVLERGEHVVRGRFAWDALPEALAIPPATAVLRLVLDGREVPFVDRGEAGDRVWLKRAPAAEEREEDRLDVAVFRKVRDGVPLVVETQVLLEVSGKGREETLPGALLEGFQPLALSMALPARVDGSALKVQVRPGRHTVTLLQRNAKDERALTAPATPMGGEDSEEVWVFEADHAVRVVNVTGVPSIVAEQTRLPAAWRALPAYRVLPGETFTLEQQRRGDESPAPSQLHLSRTLWLDFDGRGYTARDELAGRFTGDRLLMGPGTTLGRVSTGDGPGDAFITRTQGQGDDAEVGVEVRSPRLRVTADSRIEGKPSRIPAVSWAHDFQSVAAVLHLPPGFKLVHASGVDIVETTWVKAWTLFELFLVVILTVAMARLWGPIVGGSALCALVLTFQEDGAPRWLWVTVVVLAALHRVLPPAFEGRAVARVLRWLRLGTAVVVALVALGFSIRQVRVGMYPVLEQEHRVVGEGEVWGIGQYGTNVSQGFARSAGFAVASEPPPPPGAGFDGRFELDDPAAADDEGGALGGLPELEEERPPIEQAQQEPARISKRGAFSGSSSGYEGKVAMKKQKLQQIDPTAVVQTGPGLPQWGFSSVSLRFTGPVQKDQSISLVLLGPRANLMLAFVRVLLVAFLVLVAFGVPGPRWPRALLARFRGKGALFGGLAAALFMLGAPTARAAEPSPATLEALRERLLKKPACAPACATIARMALEAAPQSLRLRAEVHALDQVAVPMPGADKQWSAQSILVGGRSWPGAFREGGSLWLVLPAGRHDVVLEGALPRRDTVQLALPLVPRRASFSSSSWSLDGIREDGVPDGNLQLARLARDEKGAGDEDATEKSERDASEAVLPPFLSVERSLLLGLSFDVETRVVRLSPPGSAVVLEVPLLPGERVTTDGVRAEGGKAWVNLGPNDVEVSWSGVLAPTDKLTLEARAASNLVEVWSLEASPVWHVEEEGIPPLHDEVPRGGGARAWRPWPGEKLTLTVSRPQGVPGQTVTIERTSQQVRPGVSSTDVTLSLSLRASRGGEHVVKLPEGAELLSASIGGRPQPLRPDAAGSVRVPLVPGSQEVVLEVRVKRGITAKFTTPLFDAGGPSVNAAIAVEVPSDRWILFASGPRAGPAVLFWSFIVVLFLTGVVLSRVPFSPLELHHWVLLGLGLTQVPLPAAALVAGWLLALGWRKSAPLEGPWAFNVFQIALVTWTVVALIALVASIHEGLLGAPDMQIAGNGSNERQLRWFQDRSDGALPTAFVLNAPLVAYRLSMLAWALWLAFSLLGWLRTGWSAFSEGGLWRAIPRPPPRPRPGRTRVPEAPPGAPTSATIPHPPERPEPPGPKDGPGA
jgi:hypothetical protein